MKTSALFLGIFLTVLAGCAYGREVNYSGRVNPERDGFTLAMRQLVSDGYTVTNSDREAGFIQCERRGKGRLPWITKIDILAVTFGPNEFTVVARTDEIGTLGGRKAAKPSKEVEADAARLQAVLSNQGQFP